MRFCIHQMKKCEYDDLIFLVNNRLLRYNPRFRPKCPFQAGLFEFTLTAKGVNIGISGFFLS
jgi:hypothetical protein